MHAKREVNILIMFLNTIRNQLFFRFKSLFYLYVIVLCVLTNTKCIPQHQIEKVSEPQKQVQSQPKGLNYSSVIETLATRLTERFEPDDEMEEKHSYPFIYLTSADDAKKDISALSKTIINDLQGTLQIKGFIVRTPSFTVDKPTPKRGVDCSTIFDSLDWDIYIAVSIHSCTSESNCARIVLDISYKNSKQTEICHLALTPDLEQQKNNMIQRQLSPGNIKKPFQRLDQASAHMIDFFNCMLNKLIPDKNNLRYIMAKTDQTSSTVFNDIKTQWEEYLGKNSVAQTVLNIDCYNETFVLRGNNISELIPKDIKVLIAIDAVDIHPDFYRIRCQLLALSDLTVQLLNQPVVNFGKCLPGCHLLSYAHNKADGNNLTGYGVGQCLKSMPSDLWTYSAKVNAEKEARNNLSGTIKKRLRKYYISENITYYESMLDETIRSLMKNAQLEWEKFDENSCSAEARFSIHGDLLPFKLTVETPETPSQYTITTEPSEPTQYTAEKGENRTDASDETN